MKKPLASLLALGLAGGGLWLARARQANPTTASPLPLSNGKRITPLGEQVNVGSFPTTLLPSPDGKYVVVSSLGARSQLTVLDAKTGKVVSTLTPEAIGKKKPGLYYGLAFAGNTLYAARGSDDVVSTYTLSDDGQLSKGALAFEAPNAAGVAVSTDHNQLYVTRSYGDPKDKLKGELLIFDTKTGALKKKVTLAGYPLDIAVLREKVYVTSEQAGGVDVLNAETGALLHRIETGAQTTKLLRVGGNKPYLLVANAGSDTVSVIDIINDTVTKTILLRPAEARGIPGVTPMGMTVAPPAPTRGGASLLYVACADLNAVAVVDLTSGNLRGYLPAGWYPTAVALTEGGLLVANAKGVNARNPNGKPAEIAKGVQPQYIQNIIEGTVSRIASPMATKQTTGQVLTNNALSQARATLKNPGIEHVIYIVKENRTYDQVLGDLGKGNGDPSLTLFGREVTPNLHALAERFVLLDNFYCAAEVSGDGWNYSVSGMASEYVARNVPYGYTGKTRPYDYEGTNNGGVPDRLGVRDVATAPGGYLWDKAIEKKVSLRNFGMFTDSLTAPRTTAEEGTTDERTVPVKNALLGVTSDEFRVYDTSYADSEAWVKHGLAPAPKQKPVYGKKGDKSRISAWRREYSELLATNKMPKLMLVRLGRDHTAGTAAGQSSPRAMVADNDYAVGQLVETVSHSPLWKKTAIFILEDDAQNGYDHVDAHRSIGFVISPFVPKASHDSRFFNTDSVLRTMELLLGLNPMTLYDATAPALTVFGARPDNDAPYTAILPRKEIIGEVNGRTAYRAKDSERLLNPLAEESEADEELNEILWRSIKGVKSTPPARRYGPLAAVHERD
ncbi:bifunctional YncE family protein/alkaline phosphatase family protein [Armatimonas rosea]|uniref:YVTN family beta-propeller protein n=1 Tax=Armatimonas rosea TaxID=685828 RepID=A0A7W9SP46_ARMRO|nr:bifunctional YncE family protein/alkaline phosphatase family protein [Armatimonas rosea]MBB6050227.1 YVTN family beta-propeller protein [Armatimonas rosea]